MHYNNAMLEAWLMLRLMQTVIDDTQASASDGRIAN